LGTVKNRFMSKSAWWLFIALCAPAAAQPYGARDALVIVEPIHYAREVNRVEAVGTGEAQRSVTLYPAVSEKVSTVNFKSGDAVKKGAVLLNLDDRRQRVALQQATLNLEDAERTLERIRKSFEQSAVPKSELDRAVLLRDLALVEKKRAQIEVDDRMVIAPFDGVVGLSDIEPGDRITSQTPVATLDDRGVLIIDFKVPEAAVNLLQPGATLTVQPWRYSGEPVSARIVEKDSRIDPQTRLFRVRAEIDNRQDDFLPGTSFRTTIKTDGEEFVAIPEAALSWGPNAPYVWLARDGKAERVSVQIEQRQNDRVLVSGDIEYNDLLVTEGIQNIRQGQALRFKVAPSTEIESSE